MEDTVWQNKINPYHILRYNEVHQSLNLKKPNPFLLITLFYNERLSGARLPKQGSHRSKKTPEQSLQITLIISNIVLQMVFTT